MILHKTNFLMRALYPDFVWRKDRQEKTIYLTFDDGPVPEITEFVLETLGRFNAKATFFCIGDNIRKHPFIFEKVINEGHTVGNHTFNHLKGWDTRNEEYLSNIKQCDTEISNKIIQAQNSKKLFRPPYGRIKRSQVRDLLPEYDIIMWDVLTADYDAHLLPETVLTKALKYTENGSIVVFHDSIKANKNMSFVLPRFLEYFSEREFRFQSI
ncbi:polysaccharide deacetylase family protein [Emticicia sp. BO119]|uniref:polysaccharide deacetylase family protein n=1 Tax=Emticicia sp. BO119 TaxID=2757768 RepID=UPI0015F0404F|nr:polysaccharide deacetylase family protein [Emticicia sp. BO119]MBA4848806.1 polysaccharide deacetylase family protein [Emticicia sp. BO119]